MEVEENQPPQKKLKQATLSFLKGKNDVTPKRSESQGRKRQNSADSESPNKAAKLSKPLSVLSSQDTPNSKLIQQSQKTVIQDSSDQEVSSSSEADSVGNKSNGKCLMDRFVKKVSNDSNQEISSTNNDLDCPGEILPDTNLETDKENHKETKIEDKDLAEKPDSDCFIVEEQKDTNLVAIHSNITTNVKECVEEAEGTRDKSITNVEENCTTKQKSKEEDDNADEDGNLDTSASDDEVTVKKDENEDDGNVTKSSEMDTSVDLLNASLYDRDEISVTSTPVKSTTETATDQLTTPKNTKEMESSGTLSSSKKRGRKVDTAKKAEKESLKNKLKEEKEQMRLEKKRKIEEEKAEKEKLRKEQKEAKEKAKQDLKEKLAQEKLEKEKVKEEERLKKEEERKIKEEQRLKKQAELEAKQEEKKKREEEKKQKEEEKLKEEEEKRRKEEKVKMVFQSFFKTKETSQKSNTPSKSSPGMFVPFELKKDMHLAPTLRRDALSEQKKNYLDQVLQAGESSSSTYLQQLNCEGYKPKTLGRILRTNPKPADEMDLEIIHDSEALKKVFHKVKILQFHKDNRPPYYGTWRKETKLTPRNPFKKDEDVFDYEVDSDDEWEEEEPGESLSCSDGEEEKEDNEEEEEDGWMVPHGYLSEDEGCNEDDDITPEKLKMQQLAKAKAWDEEQKRKFHALPIVVVGCFYEHSPSLSMSGDVRLLYEYKAVILAKETPIPTVLSILELPKCEDVPLENNQAAPLQKGPKKQSVPDEAMPDLIRLVHGNICGIKRLIKEFRLFWLQKNKPSASSLNVSYEDELNESMKDRAADVSFTDVPMKDVTDANNPNNSIDAGNSISKSKEEGHGCEISKRQLEIKIMAIAAREKRQCPKKTAWFVHDNVLTEFGMENIQLPNTWVFLTTGPSVSPAPKTNDDDGNLKKEESTPAKPAPKDQRSIMDFTMTKEEVKELKKSQGECSTKLNEFAKPNENLTSMVSKPETNEKEESTPAKPALKDQRSIMDFTVTKEEVKELKKSQGECSAKPSENPTSMVSKPETNEQPTPNEKKTNGQRSIMDFAKSAVKSTEAEVAEKPVEINKMDVDPPNVIVID